MNTRLVGCLVFCVVFLIGVAPPGPRRSPFSAAAADSLTRSANKPSQVDLPPGTDLPEKIVFCTRSRYNDGHWYANIGYYCDNADQKAYAGNGKPDDGKLCMLDTRSASVSILLDAKGGSVRDPQVHYDGRRIVFSHRPVGTEFYHLYEINTDGSGLRQLTEGPFDDYEPCYLPDSGIAFVSTRCQRWVSCWMTQVGVIYRCDADGRNVRRVSNNIEHDNTPAVLPDGRLLYMRWEYVDRSQMDFHHLWTMNPDGTQQAVFFGNMEPGTVMLDAKPIPGSQNILASFSPGHGVSDHAGIACVVSPARGPDDLGSARRLHKGPLIKDPYPLAAGAYLMATRNQIVLMNDSGQTRVLYTDPGPGEVHEPRPAVPRPRERIRPEVPSKEATGRMVLRDVYAGRNTQGILRGEIKKLLILEALPKPVNFSGGMDLTSWLGTFNLERVLGTVPVEEDGSAYFEVPANRPVFYVALDGDDWSVKRMQSFTMAMPGETVGCVGCHERRTEPPHHDGRPLPLALRREASCIEAYAGFPEVLDYHRDVQPILDAACVACHRYAKRDGGVLLTGDLGPTYAHGYLQLLYHRQVADGRNGLGNQPPRALGSVASPLLHKLDGSHYGAMLNSRDRRMLWLWIESGAPYAGTYAALRNAEQQQLSGTAVGIAAGQAGPVLSRRCVTCHGQGEGKKASPLFLNYDWETRRKLIATPIAIYERIILPSEPLARFGTEMLLNLTHPEQSPLLLGPLARSAGGWQSCGDVFASTDDADYRALLAAIQAAKTRLDSPARFATPGFRPNAQYVREMKRYGILPAAFDAATGPLDVFATDDAYWRLLW